LLGNAPLFVWGFLFSLSFLYGLGVLLFGFYFWLCFRFGFYALFVKYLYPIWVGLVGLCCEWFVNGFVVVGF